MQAIKHFELLQAYRQLKRAWIQEPPDW